jgi:uncharacterized protein (TIGR02284 family)
MNKEKTIEALNSLVIINNDRIEGYETAADETEQKDLKDLFSTFQATSRKCKKELIAEIKMLGGTPDEGTRTTGKFFRVWMEVKAFLTGNDRVAILNSCEYGEEAAAKAYTDVLTDEIENISISQQTMLNAQAALLQADLSEIRSLHNVVVADVK